MVLHGVLGDEQKNADLAARLSLCNELENLEFPSGQHRLPRLQKLLVTQELTGHVEELSGHVRRYGSSTTLNSVEGRDQSIERGVLRDVTPNACLDSDEQILFRLACREHDHLCSRSDGADLLDDFETRDTRHQDVEQDQIRLMLLSSGDGAFGVTRLGDNLESSISQR